MELMKHSSILLSTQPDEAFGMAIVEAMGMGCIPVIYRSGGPWTDILEEKEGETGYAYETPAEAAKHIEQILGDSELRTRLRENSVKKSRDFNEEKFRIQIQNVIRNIEPERKEDRLTTIYRLIKRIDEFKELW